MTTITNIRECKKCLEEKLITEYYKVKDTFRHTCKECMKKNTKKWANENRERRNIYVNKWYDKNRREWNLYIVSKYDPVKKHEYYINKKQEMIAI